MQAASGFHGVSRKTRHEYGEEKPVNVAVVTLFPAMVDALRAGG